VSSPGQEVQERGVALRVVIGLQQERGMAPSSAALLTPADPIRIEVSRRFAGPIENPASTTS
jgi:hypothetical protein